MAATNLAPENDATEELALAQNAGLKGFTETRRRGNSFGRAIGDAASVSAADIIDVARQMGLKGFADQPTAGER